MDVVPANTIAIYSFSKYFGATGWRLGVVALYRDNVIDRRIAELPPDRPRRARPPLRVHHRPRPHDIGFIDRMVADSRQVALNHTAGLSLPQQVQMTLFAIFALLDERPVVQGTAPARSSTRRLALLYDGLGRRPASRHAARRVLRRDRPDALGPAPPRRRVRGLAGRARTSRSTRACSLADDAGVVLLPGGGFDGPAWSVRVSLANLDDDCYLAVGAAIAGVLGDYVAVWRSGGC